MIHVQVSDSETILIGDNETVTATCIDPREACYFETFERVGSELLAINPDMVRWACYFETLERVGSELLAINPDMVRWVRVNHRGPWFPVQRLRRVSEDL